MAAEPLYVVPELNEIPVPAVKALATEPAEPVVFWLNVGQVNVPVLKLPAVGVPSAGVTSVGEVASTGAPVPVAVCQVGAKGVEPVTGT